MSSISLTVSNQNLVRALESSEKTLKKHVGLAIGRVMIEMSRQARRLVPKAHSTLTHAINIRQINPLEGEVFAGVDYAQAVEEGTGPGGSPPRSTIEDWINVKKIVPNDPYMDEDDLAYVIGRSIAKKGTPAQPYMQPAFDSKKKRAERLLNKAIDDALREMA